MSVNDSRQCVTYLDYSTSAMGATAYQSSAVPKSLVGLALRVLFVGVVRTAPSARVSGLHLGPVWTSEDFDEPLPDEFWLGGV